MRSVISPISSRKIVPVVGQLELARLVAIGAGEAALHVAEQLRLEQRFGQAGAVDRHERAMAARALRCAPRGDELLADAALAGDQHLGVGPGDALDLLLGARPSRAGAGQLDVPVVPHRIPSHPTEWRRARPRSARDRGRVDHRPCYRVPPSRSRPPQEFLERILLARLHRHDEHAGDPPAQSGAGSSRLTSTVASNGCPAERTAAACRPRRPAAARRSAAAHRPALMSSNRTRTRAARREHVLPVDRDPRRLAPLLRLIGHRLRLDRQTAGAERDLADEKVVERRRHVDELDPDEIPAVARSARPACCAERATSRRATRPRRRRSRRGPIPAASGSDGSSNAPPRPRFLTVSEALTSTLPRRSPTISKRGLPRRSPILRFIVRALVSICRKPRQGADRPLDCSSSDNVTFRPLEPGTTHDEVSWTRSRLPRCVVSGRRTAWTRRQSGHSKEVAKIGQSFVGAGKAFFRRYLSRRTL